jgi:hypothetical protein
MELRGIMGDYGDQFGRRRLGQPHKLAKAIIVGLMCFTALVIGLIMLRSSTDQGSVDLHHILSTVQAQVFLLTSTRFLELGFFFFLDNF